MIWIIGHLLAICIGISLGLIGGGGSVLAVPILVYVMGVSPKTAIAMSLFVVGFVSLIGAIPHWLKKNVNLKTALVFTPPAMVGAYLGASLAKLPFISETFQLVCFGIVMVIASALMISKGGGKRGRRSEVKAANSVTDIVPAKTLKFPPWHYWIATPLEGLGVGILSGFVGVGGGFAIIPALVLIGGLPMKQAIGTSLLIIAFNSVTGFLGYLSQVEINWDLVVSFTFAASLGTLVGSWLNQLIDAKYLQKGFGYFVLAVAAFVLVKR
jgi:uncharacterized membrane protein YfcA